MKLKLDENMPAALADLLARDGHDVQDVLAEDLGGAADPRIVTQAADEGRMLLTFDTDFADIRDYPIGTHAGIAVFRLRDQRWRTLEPAVRRLLAQAQQVDLQGALVIVDAMRIRMRRA